MALRYKLIFLGWSIPKGVPKFQLALNLTPWPLPPNSDPLAVGSGVWRLAMLLWGTLDNLVFVELPEEKNHRAQVEIVGHW
jgi:hypothetical protein